MGKDCALAGDCAEGDELNQLDLACAPGQVITAVNFASYGMPIGTCGNCAEEPDCHASQSQGTVEEACLDKPSCSVTADYETFQDPCPGNGAKWMYVQVTCG